MVVNVMAATPGSACGTVGSTGNLCGVPGGAILRIPMLTYGQAILRDTHKVGDPEGLRFAIWHFRVINHAGGVG
jgi:hypothetical protein